MSPLVLVTVLLLVLMPSSAKSCNKKYLELTEFIQRIHKESYSPALILYGLEDDFLRYFMTKSNGTAVTIFESSPKKSGNLDKYNSDADLVVPATSKNHCESSQQVIPALKVRKFVIVTADSFKNLHQCMLYLTGRKFTRIFGISRGKTYAYLQYADNPVKRISKADPLPNSLKDLNGYMFRTIISPDLPRVYWFKDASGNRKIGGYVGQLFVSFLKKHNATFAEVNSKDVESRFMLAVTEATKNNEIDISMNAYKPVKGLKMSYPFCLISWNIIAPINGHLDPNQYFVRPFFPAVWLSIGMTVFYLIVMNILRDYLANKPVRSVWQYFSQMYLTMLNFSTEVPVKRDFRFYGQVILMAFILGNLYTVMLTSFLTIYIQIKQFNTIEDLIDNNFSVMMIDYEWKAIEDPELHPKNFERIVTLVEREVMFRERNSMVNTSFAYAMGGDKAVFYMGFQKRFAAKSLFRMIEDTLGSYYLGFIVTEFSPFTEILNEFIIEILQTGLLNKWLNDAVAQVRTNGLLKIGMVFPERKVPYPLTVYHLSFAWICLASGLVVSAVVFAGEKCIEVLRTKIILENN